MDRREYSISPILVNRNCITKVIVDTHFEEKHGDHISDSLIVELVKKLDGRIEVPESIDEEYSYFATLLILNEKQYRLIWLLEEGSIYVGVINAYRDNRKR